MHSCRAKISKGRWANMPVQRRTLSTVRDLKDIDQVLKERKNPPRPAFSTLYHARADLTPVASPPILKTPRVRASSSPRESSKRNAPPPPAAYTHRGALTPRTPLPVSNAAANSNFALLVARDVSRQPDNADALRKKRLEDQCQITINRRYNMVVDEADLIKPEDSEADGCVDADGSPVSAPRRLIRPVNKGGLRSDYYVPNRKHTMHALKQSIVIDRQRVLALARERTTLSRQLTDENIRVIVDMIGKASSALPTVALVNRAFADAVDAKLAEEDDTETSDEVVRRLKASRATIAAIPKAFYKAIKALRTNPPARVMEALRLVMLVVENSMALVTNPAFDGPMATSALKGKLDEEGGLEAFTAKLVAFDPLSLSLEVADGIRRSVSEDFTDLVEKVAAYNPRAGALVEWVHTVISISIRGEA